MIDRAIPIIRLRDLLIVSIQLALSDELVAALKEDLSEDLATLEVRGLIIEVSGVDVFDSYIAASISAIAGIARFMGVETVVAGLDAGMAIALVEMGLDMPGVRTALNLDMAVDQLMLTGEDERERERGLVRRLLGMNPSSKPAELGPAASEAEVADEQEATSA